MSYTDSLVHAQVNNTLAKPYEDTEECYIDGHCDDNAFSTTFSVVRAGWRSAINRDIRFKHRQGVVTGSVCISLNRFVLAVDMDVVVKRFSGASKIECVFSAARLVLCVQIFCEERRRNFVVLLSISHFRQFDCIALRLSQHLCLSPFL